MDDDFKDAVEIIPGRYAVCFLRHPDGEKYSKIAAGGISYCIDDELLYEPFYADFGPLNLGKTHRFCEHTKQLLQEAEKRGKKLFLYTGPQPQARANAAVLVGIYQVLYLNRTPEDAYAPLAPKGPYMPFRDASCGIPTFNLQPIDCIRGIAKARGVGFLDASGGSWRFDLAEYEHYEQVENGDLNWILPGKLLAFSGPAARPTDYVGFRAMVPEDYWEYFRRRGIQGVVRLNKKVYEAKRFTSGGFQHHELYFPDGSCPSQEILLRFLDLAERTPGALAIHCKAGLGRTGVLICSYLMKHYRFTAEEVIGYIRVCRPGSVIGPQQGFIRDIQRIMWLEGDAYRAKNGPNPPPLMWGITPAAASIAAATAAAAKSAVAAASSSSSNSAGSVCTSCSGGCGSVCTPATSSVSISLLVDATGRSNNNSGDGGAGTPSAAAATAASRLNGSSSASPAVGPATPSLNKTMSDLSLKQMRDRLTTTTPTGSTQRLTRSVSSNSGSGSSSSRAVRSGLVPQQLFTNINSGSGSSSNGGSSSATGPLTSGLVCRPSTSQSLLMRYAPANAGAAGGSATAAAAGLSAYRSTTRSSAQQSNKERPAGSSQGSSSRDATLSALLNGSIASLRATLHTDKVAAANRPKVQPAGVISQSSDFAETSWRSPISGNGIGSLTNGSRPGTGVARVLAPNGQPRKVPVSALAAMMPPPAAVTAGSAGKLQAPAPQQQQQQGTGGRLTGYHGSN